MSDEHQAIADALARAVAKRVETEGSLVALSSPFQTGTVTITGNWTPASNSAWIYTTPGPTIVNPTLGGQGGNGGGYTWTTYGTSAAAAAAARVHQLAQAMRAATDKLAIQIPAVSEPRQLPMVVGPVYALRWFRFDGYLASPVQLYTWMGGDWHDATPASCNYVVGDSAPHTAYCGHGFYSFATPSHLFRQGDDLRLMQAYGFVELGGQVWEHEYGYRSARMRVVALGMYYDGSGRPSARSQHIALRMEKWCNEHDMVYMGVTNNRTAIAKSFAVLNRGHDDAWNR